MGGGPRLGEESETTCTLACQILASGQGHGHAARGNIPAVVAGVRGWVVCFERVVKRSRSPSRTHSVHTRSRSHSRSRSPHSQNHDDDGQNDDDHDNHGQHSNDDGQKDDDDDSDGEHTTGFGMHPTKALAGLEAFFVYKS